jgi:N-acetylmuramoyl-L-alanine amidase
MTSSLWTPSRHLVLGGALTLPAAAAWADAPARVLAMAVERSDAGARLTVALDRPVSARTFFLDSPARFVVDLAATALPGPSGQGPGSGVVTRYRYAAQPGGGARIVCDLNGPAALARQSNGGVRSPDLIFDLAGRQGVSLHPEEPAPIAAPVPNGLRKIVLDPGHGGLDPGALGVTGVCEKDVTLAAALSLRDALTARGGYQVLLTRDSDVFVPLPDRVRFAREHSADLFLSMHADASRSAEAQGASLYTLSERGAARTEGVMADENWTLDLGATANGGGMIRQILLDLTQRETTGRSAAFARTAIQALQGQAPLLANTHRSAGYFVLLAPDVPAVLLEMGFLTNAADERRLADGRARDRLAGALASAIDHYFAQPAGYGARV